MRPDLSPLFVVDSTLYSEGPLHVATKQMWQDSLKVISSVANNNKVGRVLVWSPTSEVDIKTLLSRPLGFATVSTAWAPLASSINWIAPFNVYLRLICYWQFHEDIVPQVSTKAVNLGTTDPKQMSALYWSFWLSNQGIRHLDYLVP